MTLGSRRQKRRPSFRFSTKTPWAYCRILACRFKIGEQRLSQERQPESRQTVELFDRVILGSLVKAPGGLTLKELIDAVSNAVGDWPKETWHLAMFPVKGHMDRLEGQNQVRVVPGSSPVRWQLV